MIERLSAEPHQQLAVKDCGRQRCDVLIEPGPRPRPREPPVQPLNELTDVHVAVGVKGKVAFTAKPPSVVGAVSSEPPKTSMRSRIPTSPTPEPGRLADARVA